MLHIYQKKRYPRATYQKEPFLRYTTPVHMQISLKTISIGSTLLLITLLSLTNTQAAPPPPRQSPLDIIRPCSAGEYAQINQNGLVCTSASDTTAPVCEEELNCCRAQEFVKITPDGLTCIPVNRTQNTVCGYDVGQKPCSDCPPGGCCPPYTFATITTEGLRCAGIPVWGTTTLTLAEGSTYHYNLFDRTRRLRITGIQPIKLAIVQVPTIPAGIQVSLSDQGILTITTPEIHDNTRSQIDVATPLILSATNTTAGITNTTTAGGKIPHKPARIACTKSGIINSWWPVNV